MPSRVLSSREAGQLFLVFLFRRFNSHPFTRQIIRFSGFDLIVALHFQLAVLQLVGEFEFFRKEIVGDESLFSPCFGSRRRTWLEEPAPSPPHCRRRRSRNAGFPRPLQISF